MRFVALIAALIIILSVLGLGLMPALAQTTLDGWLDPVNLSHSGSTINPRMVVDRDGNIHVFWLDEYLDGMYAAFSDGNWSEPITVQTPFEDALPVIVVNETETITAVWRDLEGVLQSSRISASLISQSGVWEATREIAPQAMGFDLKVDSNGTFHLAYVRTDDSEEVPAGIYYVKSVDGGATWSTATPLYYSRYLRSLSELTARVNLSVADVEGNVHVYLSWDDRALRRVFYATSQDGGDTWQNPVEFFGPSEAETLESPFNLSVLPTQGGLLAVWQANLQSDFDCVQYYQLSTDQGNSWEQRSMMFEAFVGCPQENRFFRLSNGMLLLYTVIQDGAYLLVWDGNRWSEPQAQSTLFAFTDPDTFTSVNYGCRQLILAENDQLLSVGCDTVGNKDIWFTSKAVGDVNTWFPPPHLWAPVVTAAEGRLAITSPTLINDRDGRKHILWSQLNQDDPGGGRVVIYHTRGEGESFMAPRRILTSPDGKTSSPSVAIDSSGRLIAVWSGEESGEIYFSWADAELANSDFEWAEPVVLPVPRTAAASPALMVSPDGTVYVAYAIRFNEERGIYLVQSDDNGTTWSQPVKVFDAVPDAWEMVDLPRLVEASDGTIHILWTRNLLPGNEHSIGLYYARSEGSRDTFSTPESLLEIPVLWSTLVSAPNQILHLFWMAVQDDVISLNHRISLDAGLTWGPAENLTRFGEIIGDVDVKADKSGNLHLVEAIEETGGKTWLKYMVWDRSRWQPQEGLELPGIDLSQVQSLSLDLSPVDGQLNLSYTLAETDDETHQVLVSLYSTHRKVDIPPIEYVNQPINTPQVAATSPLGTEEPSQPASTITATAQIIAPTTLSPSGSGESLGRAAATFPTWAGLALGVALGFVALVSLYFVARLIISRKNKFP